MRFFLIKRAEIDYIIFLKNPSQIKPKILTKLQKFQDIPQPYFCLIWSFFDCDDMWSKIRLNWGELGRSGQMKVMNIDPQLASTASFKANLKNSCSF